MTDALRVGGALEAKGFDTLRGGLERAAEKAGTVGDLFAAYRHAVRDVVQIVESPGRARHERSLRRAEDYLRRHYTESVSLKVVAAVAGYAPNYFSELFHRKQGMTFASYLTGLRIGRAKELLETETLTLPRIAQISGFARAHYLSRVFKRATSETPMQYRARVLHRRRFGRQ
jgi:two-component system response regulator YesN